MRTGIAWTSGVLYSEAEEAAYKERARAKVPSTACFFLMGCEPAANGGGTRIA